VNDLPSYETECPKNVVELSMRLSLNDTRPKAIDQICEVYAKTRNIKATAEAFGIGSRTLDRLIKRTPSLSKRMADMRDEWSNGR
jgi:AraC-like DNA-binding protein